MRSSVKSKTNKSEPVYFSAGVDMDLYMKMVNLRNDLISYRRSIYLKDILCTALRLVLEDPKLTDTVVKILQEK